MQNTKLNKKKKMYILFLHLLATGGGNYNNDVLKCFPFFKIVSHCITITIHVLQFTFIYIYNFHKAFENYTLPFVNK